MLNVRSDSGEDFSESASHGHAFKVPLAVGVAIGFFAQMIDGALGMAFGVIASSTLMATGVPPAIASAAIHAAEVVTTGISGASHVWNKNVDRQLFFKLVVTGMAGGVVGAYVLTGLPEEIVKPIVTVYLAAMAGRFRPPALRCRSRLPESARREPTARHFRKTRLAIALFGALEARRRRVTRSRRPRPW